MGTPNAQVLVFKHCSHQVESWVLEKWLIPGLGIKKKRQDEPKKYWELKEAAAAKLLQSCLTLWDPIDGSPPGSPVPRFLQARTQEWVAISCLQCMKVKSEGEVTQSCPTLCDPMDCSLPGSSIHGIFQARVLEWVAIAFSSSKKREISKGHRRPLEGTSTV